MDNALFGDGRRLQCGDWEPVRESSLALREEASKYQERIHKMETTLKVSNMK